MPLSAIRSVNIVGTLSVIARPASLLIEREPTSERLGVGDDQRDWLEPAALATALSCETIPALRIFTIATL